MKDRKSNSSEGPGSASGLGRTGPDSGLESPSRWAAAEPLGADRWNRGAWLFRDSTLQRLEFLLDEAFRIPGTEVRFGVDGIIGLVPGFGDVLAGLLSMVIPLAAWIRGVAYVTVARMVVNLCIGVLVGSIPLFGDIFDIAWKTNRRNYRLLKLHLVEPRRHTKADWLFLFFLGVALALIFAIPILLIVWLLTWLTRQAWGMGAW